MSKVPYSSAIGSLMYAMVCTRPDIAHVVGVLSRYMNNPGKENWKVVQWILKYLIGTTSHALCFRGSCSNMQGYVDAYMDGDKYSVDVFVTSECIHLCILCLVTRCLFRDVSIM